MSLRSWIGVRLRALADDLIDGDERELSPRTAPHGDVPLPDAAELTPAEQWKAIVAEMAPSLIEAESHAAPESQSESESESEQPIGRANAAAAEDLTAWTNAVRSGDRDNRSSVAAVTDLGGSRSSRERQDVSTVWRTEPKRRPKGAETWWRRVGGEVGQLAEPAVRALRGSSKQTEHLGFDAAERRPRAREAGRDAGGGRESHRRAYGSLQPEASRAVAERASGSSPVRPVSSTTPTSGGRPVAPPEPGVQRLRPPSSADHLTRESPPQPPQPRPSTTIRPIETVLRTPRSVESASEQGDRFEENSSSKSPVPSRLTRPLRSTSGGPARVEAPAKSVTPTLQAALRRVEGVPTDPFATRSGWTDSTLPSVIDRHADASSSVAPNAVASAVEPSWTPLPPSALDDDQAGATRLPRRVADTRPTTTGFAARWRAERQG